jgi:hypothetical protein
MLMKVKKVKVEQFIIRKTINSKKVYIFNFHYFV